MYPARRLRSDATRPLFCPQDPTEGLPDLAQRLGHPQPRRAERPALVVVEDAADRRAVVQDYFTGLLRRRRDPGIVGRGPPLIQHRPVGRR